ncbi:hypothetical protein [Parabacteroides pacaensis]|uniref:hypothetical protein n=1 Tax=Parabacteroides pacaensis TaxID=2086575 RepID=UPI000D1052B2|nr:hypothetical protein [Parabacteroides pacaensis]
MKKSLKRNVAIAVMVACVSSWSSKAQEVNVGADLVSNYVWRGMKCGDASFQPSLSLGYKGISVTAWGSTDFTGNAFELDLSVGYSIGGFNLAITDYYVTDDINTHPYFKYHITDGHIFEGTVAYTFSEKVPITLSWNTNFAGNDVDEKAEQNYSTYMEASYPFTLWSVDMGAELGITPWKGMYADKFNVVNIGIKASKVIELSSKFSISPYTKLIFNPAADKAFIVFGINI